MQPSLFFNFFCRNANTGRIKKPSTNNKRKSLFVLIFLICTNSAPSRASDDKCSLVFGELLVRLPFTEINGVRLSSAISINRRLSKEAQVAAKDHQIQKDLDALIAKEIAGDGSSGLGFGRFALGNGYYELRSRYGARVYIKSQVVNGIRHVIICGKATKKGAGNDQRVFQIMRDVFPDFPPPPKKVNTKK